MMQSSADSMMAALRASLSRSLSSASLRLAQGGLGRRVLPAVADDALDDLLAGQPRHARADLDGNRRPGDVAQAQVARGDVPVAHAGRAELAVRRLVVRGLELRVVH